MNIIKIKTMSNKKETTLEEFAEQFANDCTLVSEAAAYEAFIAGAKYQQEQDKKLEKQQIIDAWENGYDHGACVNEDKDKYHGIQYYKETYEQ
jgi:hypothetical protein